METGMNGRLKRDGNGKPLAAVYFPGEPLAYRRMDRLVDGATVIENEAEEPQKNVLLPHLLRKSVQARTSSAP